MPMPKPTFRLSRNEVEFFRAEGYLSISQLTTPEDADRLRVSYDRLFAEQAGRAEGNQFDLAGTDEEGKQATLPQILNPSKYAPEMNDSLLLANATQLVKDLFGPGATCSIGHAIFKPAKVGAATPWHQDAAYWSPDEDYPANVSIWVPLQMATLDNGCMQVVPKSHAGMDIWQHQSIGNDPRVHGLELHESEVGRVKNVIPCPLPAGGATVHGGYALHYTAPNHSDIPRRALILGGGLPATKRATPRQNPWEKQKQTARQERAKAFQVQSAPASS